MNCLRKPTRPLKVSAQIFAPMKRSSILEQALRGLSSSTESLLVSPPSPTLLSPPSILISSTESVNCLDADSPVPSPLSPLLSPPLQASGPLPSLSEPSAKFLQLQELRRRCQTSRTPCTYIFKKGPKRGEKCGRPSCICSVLCSQHRQLEAKPRYDGPLKKLRINRLKKGKRYFFVGMQGDHRVKVMCNDVHYILLLPFGMLNPERLGNRHYLIRNLDGHTEWKQAPMRTTW